MINGRINFTLIYVYPIALNMYVIPILLNSLILTEDLPIKNLYKLIKYLNTSKTTKRVFE